MQPRIIIGLPLTPAHNALRSVFRSWVRTTATVVQSVQMTESAENITERYYSYDGKGRLSAIADKERLLFAALYDGGDNRVFTLEYDKKIQEPGQTEAVRTEKNMDTEKRSAEGGAEAETGADENDQAQPENKNEKHHRTVHPLPETRIRAEAEKTPETEQRIPSCMVS